VFNLEQSIGDWRRQMAAAGLQNADLLDELENHLREEVERQINSGAIAHQAFETAVVRIGQATALNQEYKKVAKTAGISARMKHSVLTMAGIPNHYLSASMNPSVPNTNIEPGWATYLKAALFIAPAVFLWELALVFCVPKLKELSAHAGGTSFPKFSLVNLGISELISDNWIYVASVVVLGLVLLEWRTRNWRRYRRAALGMTTFILNCLLLLSLFLIICTGGIVAGTALQFIK
jgi:hypothetical protein